MPGEFYYTYIIASRSHMFYVGATGSLFRRVLQHKQKTYDEFTSAYNCNRLVWFERFLHPTPAVRLEKLLNRWSREKKIALIEKTNPNWDDLSVGWFTPEQLHSNTVRTKSQ